MELIHCSEFTLKAKMTVTLGAPKVGFIKADGPRLCGKVTVVDISIPIQLLKSNR